jgi:transcriptional regulator with XRE-family HTH domain
MGSRRRPKPAKLAQKLLDIRSKLGLSQNEMIRRLGLEHELVQADISSFEQVSEAARSREPPLHVLLEYARAAAGQREGAATYLEILIDDGLDLPDKLPDSAPKRRRRADGRAVTRKRR